MKKYHLFSKLCLILSLLMVTSAHADTDPYQAQLDRLHGEMQDFGISLDVMGDNPFQTGTSLSNYFVNEKTLLLEEKTFFQTKANDLGSTDAVADLQFRNSVLRTHANNIMIQLSQAIRNRGSEGFSGIEAPKQTETLDQILADCKKDADCVAKTLANPQTAVQNILVENLQAAGTIFAQQPYMESIEVMSAYQLTQLLYLEVFKNQARISQVEYDLNYTKQAALAKQLRKDPTLTESERQMQIALVANTIDKWKKTIADGVGDQAKAEYLKLAEDLRLKNQALAKDIMDIRKTNAAAIGSLYDPKHCRGLLGGRRRNWCKGQETLQEIIAQTAANQGIFVDATGTPLKKPTTLPKKFFEPL